MIRSRCRTMLGAIVTMLVLGALASASASATLPVFSAGLAGTVEKPTTFTLKGGTASLIPADTTFTCTSSTGSGAITSDKAGTASFTLHNCEKFPGKLCTSPGATAGDVVFSTVPFKLVYVQKEPAAQVALDFNKKINTFATFICGGIKVVVRSSILAPVTPINTTTNTFTATFSVSQQNLEQEPRQNYTEDLTGLESSFPEASWGEGPFTEAFGLGSTVKLEGLTKSGVLVKGKIEA
jgi:hypothetical protein